MGTGTHLHAKWSDERFTGALLPHLFGARKITFVTTPANVIDEIVQIVTNDDTMLEFIKKHSSNPITVHKPRNRVAVNNPKPLEIKSKGEVAASAKKYTGAKNVKIVSCKKCGYTSQIQTEHCMRQGHYVTKDKPVKQISNTQRPA
ncbi:hypothetical protein KIN20_024340 [Parelaphostrongylus tenuis]|uniref:PiggyBac transposable element-derived protein domain-containing protein n=1 Tax=Parelaphostrongylus tenuis TaxID=148309 RepID=A0AAD5N7G9_PARTN|nr:hypothetical protein KIN20_024340 [Parelaphostrongylus tenuis]